MRAYDSDFDESVAQRTAHPRSADRDTAGMLRALAAGRTDAISPTGMLRLQRIAGNSGVNAMLDDQEESPVKDVVGSSGGQPLDAGVRADMEGRFGADFGDVRVHTDDKATESAKSVGAHAYTAGSNVVFQREHYAPETDTGKRMLAHELTHVLQQKAGPVDGTPAAGGINLSHPSDRFEQEATATADRVVSSPAPASAPVQRQAEAAKPEEEPEEEAVPTQRSFVQRQEEEEKPEEATE